ncbi:MAG: hypothetical protein H6780_00225 [Candidatus Nomurabacteria bacterium]|nr:MAG: hypothetical protein H6780_00225 [Candidatus Nomurabacteria bacterium]
MLNKIHVQPLGWLERIADVLMLPIMYIISGTFRETPQQTHRWNNTKLKSGQVAHLKDDMQVFCEGNKSAGARFWLKMPFFHIPLLGGWKDYVVLQPTHVDQEWHIGWLAHDVAGVSRIKVRGPVRLLLGPGDVSFFGVNSEGDQLKLQEISRGRIGDGGEYSKTPLL